jgi:hypothetical protein
MGFFGGGGSAGIGGSTGATDNAILRADGTGAATLQNSDLNVDDATTTTQNNVAITNQHSGQTNSALVLTPKGTGAFIVGPKPDGTTTGGNARGANSADLQTLRTSSTRIASGASSFVAGESNTGSGAQSVALGGPNNASTGEGSSCVGGRDNTASSQFSVCYGGRSNTASNLLSVVIGGRGQVSSGNCSIVAGGGIDSGLTSANTASAEASATLGGRNALADRFCMQAFSAGRFSANGDAQHGKFVLRCKTTTNSAVEMALDGSTTYLTIPSGKVIFCNIKVVGVKSDGSVVATYERQYAAKNVAGTSSEVFAPITIGTDLASGTLLEVATVDAGDYIRIRPTGIASETWRWVATVDAVEVAYGT